MRNSSDIFCLREPKSGENDGTQIFSVNGSSSVKINRKPQNISSTVFEFGPKQERPPPVVENAAHLEPVPESVAIDKDDEVVPSRDVPIDEVTTSSMKRNPLTGDGICELQHNRQKKSAKKIDQGLW